MTTRTWAVRAIAFAGLALGPLVPRTASACPLGSLCNANPSSSTILVSPRIFITYWGWGSNCSTSSCAADTAGEIPVVEQNLRSVPYNQYVNFGLPGTRWYNVKTQYTGYIYGFSGGPWRFYNYEGITTAPSWFDNTHPYVAYGSSNGPQAIQDEVSNAVTHFKNLGYQLDGDSLLIIARPPGAGGIPNLCAYHASLSPLNGYNFAYAFVDLNYGGFFNGDVGSDCYYGAGSVSDTVGNISGVLQHEVLEAITDPRPNLGSQSISWQGFGGYETGDMCSYLSAVSVAVQPSTYSMWNQVAVAHVSNKAAGGACVYARSTQADVFSLGSSSHLWHQHLAADSSISTSSWYDWGTLGTSGTLETSPSAVSWAPGRSDVFVVDNTSHLRHAYTDDSRIDCTGPDDPCYDDWGMLPPGWTFTHSASIGVASWGPARLDVFALGTSTTQPGVVHLFQRIWDSGDQGWQDRGSPSVSLARGPTAAAYSPGSVDVFAVGTDSNIYHGVYKQWDNSFTWSLWHTNPSSHPIPDSADVASWVPGRFDVFVIDSAGSLFDCGGDHNSPWASCVPWTPPTGITFRYKPSVVSLGDQRLVVAARGSDGSDWLKEFDWGQDTGPWVSTGGSTLRGPELTSW